MKEAGGSSRPWYRAGGPRAVAVILLCIGIVGSCGPPGDGAGAPPEADSTARETASPTSDRPLAGSIWRLVEFQSMDDAIGTWSAEPSGDGSSGRFEFGPLATTRALCPPPSLDEQIAAHAEFVRSYLLKDGRLYLSLMADGGIYAWEPHADLEAAILRASPDYTRKPSRSAAISCFSPRAGTATPWSTPSRSAVYRSS